MTEPETKPDWLTPELEARARGMLDANGAGQKNPTDSAHILNDILYDDGVYELTQDSPEATMQLGNALKNGDPDITEISQLAAAISYVGCMPIKLFCYSDITNQGALIHVKSGETPDEICQRYYQKIADEAAMLEKQKDMKAHGRERLIDQIKQLGDCTITTAKTIVNRTPHAAFHITFSGIHSREKLTEDADTLHGIFEEAEKNYREVMGKPALSGREVSMAGVLPGSSNTLYVHIPKSYEHCFGAVQQMASSPDRPR